MTIPFSSLQYLHEEIKDELNEAYTRVLEKNWFIQGEECSLFEEEYSKYCSSNYTVGCGNGLDAIMIALIANGIGPGDEVILPAFTFIATAIAVERTGARPVFVDVEEGTTQIDVSKIEEAITEKTKAIVPVFLYGQCSDMDSISRIANYHGLRIIIDAAQAHGAEYNDKKLGQLGADACFSFYPGKNLGALGDGGAIITNSRERYDLMKMITNYGSKIRYHHDVMGVNSRLDELQAAFLRVKLRHLDEMIDSRTKIASRYLNEIKNPKIRLPKLKYGKHVWHIFDIHVDDRDNIRELMKEKGIETNIHYPIPIHLQKSFSKYGINEGTYPITESLAKTELSLPLYYGMTDDKQSYIIDELNRI